MLLDTTAPALSPNVKTRRASSLLVLYAMTGFSSLIAEQVLEKYVTLLVGATASASAVIVFTYFLGFAVGGLVAATLLKRGSVQNPLRAYAGIELLTGCACVVFSFAFPTAIAWMAPLQNLVDGEFGKYLVRFLCGCILVLPIAGLMGASFPLLAQALDDDDTDAPRRWSVAYSANLAGALLASLAAPFVLFPIIGLRGAMGLCLAVCGAVAAFVQFRRRAAPPMRRKPGGVTSKRRWQPAHAHLVTAAFLSGCVFFALEIIWIHLVGAVIGGSVYAFSWMLTSVLAGLWGGSWVANRLSIRPARVLLISSFALLIQLAAWPIAPALFALAPKVVAIDFYSREIYRLLVTCTLIVPAALLLGMIYPALLRSPLPGDSHNDSAWFAGYMSAANSLGCLAGALLSTFLLIDRLGSEWSLKIITLLIAALWLVFEFRDPDAGKSSKQAGNRIAAGALAAMVVGGVYLTHWNWRYLTSGASTYFGENPAAWTDSAPATRGPDVTTSMDFRDESVQGGFTTVLLKRTEAFAGSPPTSSINLYTNGKLQGNDDQSGMVQGQQVGTAILPSLFTRHFQRALLIGLGTGQGATVLKQLGFERLDIAELSPGILRAVNAEFRHDNVLKDPTVHTALEDGRNLLLTSAGTRYDLITIGLTTIWFSGATNLYSREFYEVARRHMADNGVLQQWVQLHRIGPEEIASAIASVRSVFPYVSYWTYEGAGMVLAANHPLDPQAAQGELLASMLHLHGGLALGDAHKVMDRILQGRLVSEQGVDRMIQQMRPVINTDQNRYIEYATPRYSSAQRDWANYNLEFFRQWDRQPPVERSK